MQLLQQSKPVREGYSTTHAPKRHPARKHPAQGLREPAQQRARRGSQCTQPNRSRKSGAPAPPHAERAGRAVPETAAPRRSHTQARVAPFTSRKSSLESSQNAPVRIGQFRARGGTRAVATHKAFLGRQEPQASRAQPATTRRKRSESKRSSERAAGASAHTPTARAGAVCLPRPAPSGPRRAQNRRAAPQSHSGTRRTFHEPRSAARDTLRVPT